MQWYYSHNGQQAGPVPQADFDNLVHSGVITPSTLVWREGMSEWRPASEVGVSAAAPPIPLPAAGNPSVAAPAGDAAPDPDTAVCAVSGQRYPKSQMIQYEGKWIGAAHRDEFFQRLREGVGQRGDVRYAGFWIRFVALFIDGICLLPATIVLVFVFGMVFPFLAGPESPGAIILSQMAINAVSVVIAICYELFFIRKFDATPGKLAVGIRLLRADGSKLSVGRIIGRYFAKMVSGIILCIGYILAAFDSEKRALHDHMCDTRVTYKN
ncbi:putative membrane protein [Opitutaceae bacterium TAV1]|nr:putative membrane protein [Opitutaceae bacterium TAV1]